MPEDVFPCVCCGRSRLDEPPGSYDICPVCFWEDDPVQLRYPWMAGGANHVSLIEGQQNFAEFGACERRVLEHVQPPDEGALPDPEWRPIDTALDRFESRLAPRESRREWPADLSRLYWWRPTFWQPADGGVAG